MSTNTPVQSRALSRRNVLKHGAVAAAASAAAPVFSGFAGPLTSSASAAGLPLVTPKSSQLALESFGVCAMPLHDHSVYHYRSAWIGNLASMGVSFIRGTYKQGFDPTYQTVSLLRQHHMKWGMVIVTDLRQSDADIVARVNDIARKAADVCLSFEGINEPNYNRGGGGVMRNWREVTLPWASITATRPKLSAR